MKTKIKTNRKNIKKWIVIISSVFILFGCNQMAVAAEITAQKMIELTNKSRAESGLLPLIINEKLTAAAEAKADDMFEFQYFDHNSPNGVTPWYWIKSAGYDYLYAGENLAIDFVTAEGTHMALMRSITHRDNIMKPNYTEIGIAVKKGIFDGNESIIIVEEFGKPMEKIIEKSQKSEADIKGDVDVNSQEDKTEEIKEEIIPEIKKELVEIKSPVIYLKDENYEKEENKEDAKEDEEIEDIKEDDIKNDKEISKTNEITIEKTNEEFVFPIMFPVENIKPLNEVLKEDIFWNKYEEKEKGIFTEIISFLNYKFLFVEMSLSNIF